MDECVLINKRLKSFLIYDGERVGRERERGRELFDSALNESGDKLYIIRNIANFCLRYAFPGLLIERAVCKHLRFDSI